MGISIDLYGISDLIDDLERMAANADKVEDIALDRGAQPILNEARQTTEFIDRSGKLRKSLTTTKIKFTMSKGKKEKYKLIGAFGKDVYYGESVEFGHASAGGKFTPAHPFLGPAFVHNREETTRIIAETLREALKK